MAEMAGALTSSRRAAPPALLVRRASEAETGLLGRRARFMVSSHTASGEWLAYGWRDGLRIVSDIVEPVQDLNEPAIWLQEERDFYGEGPSINRYAVGLSRVWMEQYVSCESRVPDVSSQEAWLEELNRDPNEPTLRRLHPLQGYPDPVGRRIVLTTDTEPETDLRAVSPVRMTDGGELAVAVMAERDWYRWGERNYGKEPHPSLRWVPAAEVWVE